MLHFMFVHFTFSSVWVAEWPPFGQKAAHSVGRVFSLFCQLVVLIISRFFCLEQGFVFVAPVPVHCFFVTFISTCSNMISVSKKGLNKSMPKITPYPFNL